MCAGDPAVALRPARSDDAPAVADIWSAGWRDGHLGFVPQELVDARTDASFRTRSVARVGDTTVAVLDGEVAGFVMVVGDEVEQVYVSSAHRGSGVAATLIAEAERQVAAAGHASAWLAVVPGNARARAFYERTGWVDEGPFDYGAAPGEGAGEGGATAIAVPCHRYTKQVGGAPTTRLLTVDDAPELAALLRINRSFLAPWEPIRDDGYFTAGGQRTVIRAALEQHRLGSGLPHAIVDASGAIVGRVTLSGIVRGPFRSCSMGYWVGEAMNGRGVATATARRMKDIAFGELGLHRIQAETLVHNVASQRVLERNGFVRYGLAPAYLEIAGRWQDHVMYQALAPDPGPASAPDR